MNDDGSCIYDWEPCENLLWGEDFESYSATNIDSQTPEWLDDNVNPGVDVTNNLGFSSNQSILVEQDDDLVHVSMA